MYSILFFCNQTATTEIYSYLHTLSLHDSLPFCLRLRGSAARPDGLNHAFEGDTRIFITPGYSYSFRAIDGLMTNFHLPRSTLFMLVSALMGRERKIGRAHV